MGEIRNAERTRKAILQATWTEFIEKGYSGTRIDSIAKRAGINKQLIYHYFNGKDQLIKESIDEFISSLPSEQLTLPANPVQIAEFRFKVNVEYLLEFLKFTAWEATDHMPDDTIGVVSRKKVLQAYNEDMLAKQELGLVPQDLDPTMLTLMLSSLTIYPLLYDKVTQMITGYSPENPEFQQKWAEFLRKISERVFKG